MNIASYIEHTLLKPTATHDQIEKLCAEAIRYNFAAVCVHQYYVPLCKRLIKSTVTSICTVVSFPFGAVPTTIKVFESEQALKSGADEIDMVMNQAAFKNKGFDIVSNDIKAVKQVVNEKILKVIIETCYLSKNEIIDACRLVADAGADFVKTSTGYGTAGASVDDVRLIKQTVGDKIRIKAAGGIKTKSFAIELISAGAARIGTSSALAIIES
jgi:deoxyribose-phosphate aldolase